MTTTTTSAYAKSYGTVLVVRQFRLKTCCNRTVKVQLTLTVRGELHGYAALTCPKCKARYQVCAAHEPDLFAGDWLLELSRREDPS